jgi:nitroimidazol reductase NimA-like FMN-containing flavoprotein (pyridoxamine 5'-phosphate oxidase superfamily)
MPTFRDLDHEEIAAILARNHVGRLAFSFRDRVDIEPIHYAYRDGYLYCRTEAGTKLTTLARHPWVAFEVDEVHGLFRWQSVVARGTVYWVEPGDDRRKTEIYEHSVTMLRRLIPTAFTDRDPTPDRTAIFRVYVDDVTGRMAGPDAAGVPTRDNALAIGHARRVSPESASTSVCEAGRHSHAWRLRGSAATAARWRAGVTANPHDVSAVTTGVSTRAR